MIQATGLGYRYPGGADVLTGATFSIADGELALVTGASGSGKSTLLRCLNGLVPHYTGGTIRGAISVAGHDPIAEGPAVMSRYVGLVFQDPEAQCVVEHVEDEVAFALENLGVPTGEMQDRVADVLEVLGLLPLRDRLLDTLSGGERQRVAIAAALVLGARILVLDEPTSQLDPLAADELLRALVSLNCERGVTVVLSEHRMERILPYASQVVHLPGRGQPPICGAPQEVLPQMDLVPPLIEVARAVRWLPLPLTLAEARPFADAGAPLAPAHKDSAPKNAETVLDVQDVHYAYGNTGVLSGVSLTVGEGELLALLGDNGSGKTTLLRCLVGLLVPYRGRILVAGQATHGRSTAELCQHIGYLPQNPDDLLFADSVRQELEVTLVNQDMEDDPPVNVDALLDRLGLSEVADAYPRDLSVGQRQRVALAAIAVTRPRVMLLDEPTRGMDYAAKDALVALLRGWQAEGTAVILVTHDVELVAACANQVAILEGGRIAHQGEPSEVLRVVDRYTPQVARLFPATDWLTPQQAIAGLRPSPRTALSVSD